MLHCKERLGGSSGRFSLLLQVRLRRATPRAWVSVKNASICILTSLWNCEEHLNGKKKGRSSWAGEQRGVAQQKGQTISPSWRRHEWCFHMLSQPQNAPPLRIPLVPQHGRGPPMASGPARKAKIAHCSWSASARKSRSISNPWQSCFGVVLTFWSPNTWLLMVTDGCWWLLMVADGYWWLLMVTDYTPCLGLDTLQKSLPRWEVVILLSHRPSWILNKGYTCIWGD